LAFFVAIWLFLRVDLVFFAYDYLATLALGLNLKLISGFNAASRFFILSFGSRHNAQGSGSAALVFIQFGYF